MRKIRFIINPVAGDGSSKLLLSKIKEKMSSQSAVIDFKISSHKGHITELAEEAVHEKFTDLIVAGGDGTIIEAVNGILGAPIRLGILPSGTGNDYARSVGISSDFDEAMENILETDIVLSDIGLVNGEAFLNSVGVGIDSDVVETTQKIKNMFPGSMAYALSTVKSILTYRAKHVRIHLDDVVLERKVMLIAIGNGKYIGGGMKITPNAKVDSGDFEICIVRDISKPRFLKLFPSVFKGDHVGIAEVEMFQAKSIQIESLDKPLSVNADGSIVGSTPAKVSMNHYKMQILRKTSDNT